MTVAAIELESRPAGGPPGSAAAEVVATDVAGLRRLAATATPADVDRALAAAGRTGSAGARLEDFAALLSPAAGARLEDLAQTAHRLTVQRFGRTVHLFAPLYLSNECVSVCTYCGFSAGNRIARRTLAVPEVVAEAEALADRGFRHVLLVAGEHARIVSKDYLVACAEALAPIVPSLSVEVQVWDTGTYRRLVEAGCDGLVVYQETYDRATYAVTHLKGKKRNHDWRLAAPDRGGEAGMRRLGIGALLGLHGDWRAEAIAVAAHARALVRRWWRAEVSVALPRLRPAAGGYEPADPVGDRDFVQLLCALRLALPDIGISLSTREAPAFRDALVPL
ncbi:MAG TPA: radical SAM protein, partial [Acidimicrobiales bacterium]